VEVDSGGRLYSCVVRRRAWGTPGTGEEAPSVGHARYGERGVKGAREIGGA